MVWKTLNQSYISVPVYPAEPIKTRNGFIKFWTQNDFLMQALLANKALNLERFYKTLNQSFSFVPTCRRIEF